MYRTGQSRLANISGRLRTSKRVLVGTDQGKASEAVQAFTEHVHVESAILGDPRYSTHSGETNLVCVFVLLLPSAPSVTDAVVLEILFRQ